LVPALGNMRGAEAGHAFDVAEQVVEHVTPMAEHVEDDAAAVLLAVVPRWPLRRLPVAFEHPITELAAHRKNAAEETGLDQHLELEQAGQKDLVLHHAVLDAGFFRRARDVERVRERLGHRLLAIDVLAGGDRAAQELRAQLGGGGVEKERVLAAPEGGIEVSGPARDAVRLGELRELGLVAADQDRIGHHGVAVLQRDAALRADGENRADQVLVRPHAPADAVHDDAEPLLRHFKLPFSDSRSGQLKWASVHQTPFIPAKAGIQGPRPAALDERKRVLPSTLKHYSVNRLTPSPTTGRSALYIPRKP